MESVLNGMVTILYFAIFLVAAYFSLKKFRVLFWVNMSILILYAVVGGIGGYMPSFRAILLLLFPYGLFFVFFNIVTIIKFWEDYGIVTLLFVSILGFWLPGLAIKVGRDIRVKVFENRLDLYETAVKELTPMIDVNGLNLRGEQIPQEYRKLAYSISAEKKEGILFHFVWDPGFPMLGSSFIYCSDDFLVKKGEKFRCEPPYCEQINEHWFRVGD